MKKSFIQRQNFLSKQLLRVCDKKWLQIIFVLLLQLLVQHFPICSLKYSMSVIHFNQKKQLKAFYLLIICHKNVVLEKQLLLRLSFLNENLYFLLSLKIIFESKLFYLIINKRTDFRSRKANVDFLSKVNTLRCLFTNQNQSILFTFKLLFFIFNFHGKN